MRFQSTLPVWGATGRFFPPHPLIHISIHAPRVGSDHHAAGLCRCKSISIHAPRVGSDLHSRPEYARGHISIHAPRVGSDGTEYENFTYYFCISIHAPRVGSDFNPEAVAAATQEFQSTLPVWGATDSLNCNIAICDISIHAPRVGSDRGRLKNPRKQRNFNPRSPCGERHYDACMCPYVTEFQSTLPVWGATAADTANDADLDDFNPRSPCGERRSPGSDGGIKVRFQSTLPVWGATYSLLKKGYLEFGISIHAPRVGSDHG